MPVPKTQKLLNLTLEAIEALGGSGSIREIVESVIERTRQPDAVVRQLHKGGPKTELEYRLGWARTYLKNDGLIENSQRGIWTLTPKGRRQNSANTEDATKDAHGQNTPPQLAVPSSPSEIPADAWSGQLLSLLQSMPPDAFERLCQRLLRESGFIEVEVTGRIGDGGIDGHGLIRLNGLVSFPVLFQCKRYTGFVTPSQVRDFRGAMAGRADKGLFITTGTFTREAKREALREGVPPIDLIDGDLLLDTLKELGLGIETRWVKEVVRIDTTFFKDI